MSPGKWQRWGGDGDAVRYSLTRALSETRGSHRQYSLLRTYSANDEQLLFSQRPSSVWVNISLPCCKRCIANDYQRNYREWKNTIFYLIENVRIKLKRIVMKFRQKSLSTIMRFYKRFHTLAVTATYLAWLTKTATTRATVTASEWQKRQQWSRRASHHSPLIVPGNTSRQDWTIRSYTEVKDKCSIIQGKEMIYT